MNQIDVLSAMISKTLGEQALVNWDRDKMVVPDIDKEYIPKSFSLVVSNISGDKFKCAQLFYVSDLIAIYNIDNETWTQRDPTLQYEEVLKKIGLWSEIISYPTDTKNIE